MPNDSLRQFLDEGQRSGLFSEAHADAVLAQATVDQSLTPQIAAARLVENKALTAFQAARLLAGCGDECTVAGRYRILEQLGQGGMGTVYKAHDTQLDRDVAVKILPAERLNDADAVTRFRREARALAKLSHPNIIQAFDSGEDKGRHFLVMEYVQGASLAAILREQGAVPPTLAADMIYQAALGLQHAHEKGLVHRDLKPGNLHLSMQQPLAALSGSAIAAPRLTQTAVTKTYLPTSTLGKGVIKILDLGLARFFQDHLGEAGVTKEGIGMGTPDYMAPEQFRDAVHADARTDIYGLGCTLYQLISGTVPFPGSSFHEKAEAHAKKEPIPLEERCPEIPGGLAIVASKMMGKHPADRFQTAAEVAEALVPYVAGASHSMIMLRQTMQFHAGQMTMRGPKRRRVATWVATGLAAACVIVLMFLAWPSIFPRRLASSSNDDVTAQATSSQSSQNSSSSSSSPSSEPIVPKVVTIENGVTVAKNGTGQFTTIADALEQVNTGQTIRVVDDARYEETLKVTDRSRYDGIVIEAVAGATLAMPSAAKCLLMIQNVPRIQVRGFRIDGGPKDTYTIAVLGPCQGTTLDGLDIRCPFTPAGVGLSIENNGLTTADLPVVVQNCSLTGFNNAVLLSGFLGGKPNPCRRVHFRQNRIRGCELGIGMTGLLQDIHIVGNTIWNCAVDGDIVLAGVAKDSKGLVIANNSLQDPRYAIHLEQPIDEDIGLVIRNNVVLAEAGPDLAFTGKRPLKLSNIQIDHNFRQVRLPAEKDANRDEWLPWTNDTCVEKLPLASTNSKDAKFLQPQAGSPLVTGGAGGDYPEYVGAIPPEGVEPWNWQWTWDTVIEKRLTVSKDAKTGGRFQTIRGALGAARANMTIRVVDAERYAESLVIDDPKAQDGLVLEAPQHATLLLAEDSLQCIALGRVSKVVVRGFRFEVGQITPREGGIMCFVMVRSGCPGLILEELEFQSTGRPVGVVLLGASLPDDADPMIVRRCKFKVGPEGIAIVANPQSPVSGLMVVDNRIRASRGIFLQGGVRRIIVAGNLVSNGDQAGIQFENPTSDVQRVLVANNTVFNNAIAVRFWRDGNEDGFEDGQVEFRGNVLMRSQFGDLLYVRRKLGAKQGETRDGSAVDQHWRFAQNWRDRGGSDALFIFKLAKDDRELEPAWVVSGDESDAEVIRPKADSPLAKGGAGGDLPAYAGALPPKGASAWDWNKTWNKWMKKPD